MIKTGAALGYRPLDNATVQVGMNYTRDITSYSEIYNQTKGNEYYDMVLGASYAISDMWKVSINYKKMMGLANYYSDSVYLGTVVGF